MGSHRCKVFPYLREDVISIQESKQRAGWNITAFNLLEEWKCTRGEGVKIAVLDSGCQLDHPDIVNNLLPGENFVEEGQPPNDELGHGTHCVGTICAEDNDFGIVGVAPHCQVIPVKVLDKYGNGTLEDVAKGVRWAADHGADIITMSLGSPVPLQQVRKSIKYAIKKGVVVFCAAGNAGNTENVFYPGRYPETITIGSIDENMERAAYSNTGENLDFMAPGTKILSTVPPNWYAEMSGTSMATPWVAGVAALYLSSKKKNDPNNIPKTPDDYREVFRKYTIPINKKLLSKKCFYQGFGILDPRLMRKDLFGE